MADQDRPPIVALEEHFVVPELLDAWRRLPEEQRGSGAGFGDDPLARALKDTGEQRLAAMADQGVDVQAWNDRVAWLTFDFVVCAKDATVLAAIDLEDPSRQTVERAEARQRRSLAAASAGLRVIHWQADALPDTAAIQAALAPGSPLLTTG